MNNTHTIFHDSYATFKMKCVISLILTLSILLHTFILICINDVLYVVVIHYLLFVLTFIQTIIFYTLL